MFFFFFFFFFFLWVIKHGQLLWDQIMALQDHQVSQVQTPTLMWLGTCKFFTTWVYLIRLHMFAYIVSCPTVHWILNYWDWDLFGYRKDPCPAHMLNGRFDVLNRLQGFGGRKTSLGMEGWIWWNLWFVAFCSVVDKRLVLLEVCMPVYIVKI